ncbi:MAG: hypothetical protein KDE27_13240, partial [Planctomycetes bacterium]|nr:hypothetical protein [Planctomycetota bacterium]
VLWSVSEPGLGIAHSKYWHDVEASAIADGVFVKSQGGGGVILVELDGEDGARRSRHDRKR